MLRDSDAYLPYQSHERFVIGPEKMSAIAFELKRLGVAFTQRRRVLDEKT